MASLNKEQNVFRREEDKIINNSKKIIKADSRTARDEVYLIAEEYNSMYGGGEIPPSRLNEMKRRINSTNKELNTATGAIITEAMNDNMDNIYLGYTYSYSKASDSYLNYKLLTDKQKAITRNVKIDGKTYLDRLNFHSDNLTKKTSAIIQNGIRLGMSNQQIAKNINQEAGINYRHALTISRTETGRVGSLAAEEAANNAISQGVEFKKTWRQYASKDPRHDHSQMEGVTVKAGELFHLPSGSSCQYPRLTGFAGDDINCKCEAIEFFEGFEPEERRQGRTIVDIPSYDVWYKSAKGRS